MNMQRFPTVESWGGIDLAGEARQGLVPGVRGVQIIFQPAEKNLAVLSEAPDRERRG